MKKRRNTSGKWVGWIVLIALTAFVFTSCGGAVKKCNGEKAIMTPMGPM